jgi:uncharacterized membrane protein YdjX (TVP38/TMEM64 family)
MFRGLAFAILLVAILVAVVVLPVETWLAAAIDWARSNQLQAALVFLLAYTVAGVIMTPIWILMVTAGYTFGWWLGAALAAVGNVLGAVAAFVVARSLALEWITRKVRTNARLAAVQEAAHEHGFTIVLLTRLSLVFPYNLFNYVAGASGMPLKPYAVATLVGMIPAVMLYVFVGTTVRSVQALVDGDLETGTAGQILLGVGLVALVTLVVMLTRIATRRLRRELDAAPAAVADRSAS